MTDIRCVAAFSTLLWAAVFCQDNCKPMDCVDLKCYGVSTGMDGPHKIYPGRPTLDSVDVSCDQTAPGGGWIVYQRRVNGKVNFTRTWIEYKNGFGEKGGPDKEVWLGNEIVYQLIQSNGGMQWELRIEGYAYDDTNCSVVAKNFSLEPESDHYRMRFGRIGSLVNMNASDMAYFRDQRFDTPDNNRHPGLIGCTYVYPGGWWFRQCIEMYLNGGYFKSIRITSNYMFVKGFNGRAPLRRSQMLFRPSESEARTCNNPCLHGGTCEYKAASNERRCMCADGFSGPLCGDDTGSRAPTIVIMTGLVLFLLLLVALAVAGFFYIQKKRAEAERQRQLEESFLNIWTIGTFFSR